MRRTIPTTIAFFALSIFATGCAGALQTISAKPLDCPAVDVEITNDDHDWQTRSWQASCHGRNVTCSRTSAGTECRQEKQREPEPPAEEAASQVDFRHHWEEYSFEPCGVAAPLPGAPESRRKEVSTPLGPLPIYSAAVEGPNFAAVFACSSLGAAAPSDVGRVLDSARDGAVAGIKGTLEKEVLIDVNGNPGRDVWFRMDKGYGRARLVVRGRSVVSVVLAPLSEFTPSEIRQMFDGVTIRQPNVRAGRRTARL